MTEAKGVDLLPVDDEELADLQDKIIRFTESLSEGQQQVVSTALAPWGGDAHALLERSLSADDLNEFLRKRPELEQAQPVVASLMTVAVSIAFHC